MGCMYTAVKNIMQISFHGPCYMQMHRRVNERMTISASALAYAVHSYEIESIINALFIFREIGMVKS